MELKKEILEILRADARRTDEEIALMLGKEEQEIARERAALVQEGILVGYNAVVNWNKLDGEVQAVIEVRITPKRERGFDAVAERIYSFEEVSSVYLMSGGYDLLVMIKGSDMRQVALFVAEKLSTIDGVLSTATHFVLRKYKENGHQLTDAHETEDRMVVS